MKRPVTIAIWGCCLFVALVSFWGVWTTVAEVNDWINRCADESHGAYIEDEAARRKACE